MPNTAGAGVTLPTADGSSAVVTATNGIFVNASTVNSSYSIASGFNGLSVGPMTVASGAVVTIASGQRWVVL